MIENALRLEVSTGGARAIKQLNAILGVIGQRVLKADKLKVGGETIYRYQLDAERLQHSREIIARRREQQGWTWIHEHYGWTDQSDDD